MLGTIEKAGRVIALFTVERPEWGVSEAAAQLRLPKSSVHALLRTLAAIGLLEQQRAAGRYRLGWALVTHAHTLLSTTAYRPHALRAMRALASRYGETVQLATLSGGRVVTIDRIEAPQGVRRPASARLPPPDTSAVGKVLTGVPAPPHAYDEGESDPEVCCVAAPLRGADGTVLAALSLSAPRRRFEQRREDYTRAVVHAADDASERLRRASTDRSRG